MKKLFDKCMEMYKKYKEIIDYLVVGGVVTVINFISYCIPSRVFKIDPVISQVIAWVVSVISAYVLNKIFVFKSKTNSFKELMTEMWSFIFGRLATGALCDVGLFVLMYNILHINDLVSKVTTQVLVVILNYVLSKLVIFKNKAKTENTDSAK